MPGWSLNHSVFQKILQIPATVAWIPVAEAVVQLWGTRAENKHHDDVIKWKHFPRCWPYVRVIYRSQVDSPHKGQWRGALIFSLICAWINGWVNNCEAGALRGHRAHHDCIVIRVLTSKQKHLIYGEPSGNAAIVSYLNGCIIVKYMKSIPCMKIIVCGCLLMLHDSIIPPPPPIYMDDGCFFTVRDPFY